MTWPRTQNGCHAYPAVIQSVLCVRPQK
uniref:Uncharacterized protein n=1 Tax=Anguilla anguilla TaxID=7936 RepID=A0A0E9U643_ANGAN